jgi:hypothetical protein
MKIPDTDEKIDGTGAPGPRVTARKLAGSREFRGGQIISKSRLVILLLALYSAESPFWRNAQPSVAGKHQQFDAFTLRPVTLLWYFTALTGLLL